jgi:uncharacterized protein YecT (DUF1311 family)
MSISIMCILASTPTAFAQHMNAADAPCRQPASDFEETKCFSNAAQLADEKLNQTYNAIRDFFRSRNRTSDDEALRDSQQLWIKFRDANCAAERKLYGNGSAASMSYFACLEAMSRHRMHELVTEYGWLSEKFRHYPQP